jgi:hypothetical protein
MAIPACVGAALVAVIIALVVLPVGPNVDKSAMEASVLPEIQRDAPPPADANGVKSFSCGHGLLSTKDWTCKLRQDISLLPDVTVTYKVTVSDDGCWQGRSDRGSNPSGEFLPTTVSGCVSRSPRTTTTASGGAADAEQPSKGAGDVSERETAEQTARRVLSQFRDLGYVTLAVVRDAMAVKVKDGTSQRHASELCNYAAGAVAGKGITQIVVLAEHQDDLAKC